MSTPEASAANHEILLGLAGKVDMLAVSLDKSTTASAIEFDKMWKHIDARDEKLSSAIAAIADRQANFGKPNVAAIVSVCVLIGSIAVAFIAPIKSDISRESDGRKELALAVVVKEEKIQHLREKSSEFDARQRAIIARIEEISANGSGIVRERLAVIENDLRWMRGEKLNQLK